MRRREFIAVMGGAAAWPLVAQARQQAKRLIGFLTPEPRRGVLADLSAAFLDRLGQLGYREHENFEMEARYADGNAQRLPGLAQELAALHPDVILDHNTSSAVALKHATSSIPIVVAFVIDPVGAGLVASEARPGGNLTGLLFAPAQPLGANARRHVQARVDASYDMFVRSVARNRGVEIATVRNGFGQGRLLSAQAAKAEGMVDGVAQRIRQGKAANTSRVREIDALVRPPANGSSRAMFARRAAARQRAVQILSL